MLCCREELHALLQGSVPRSAAEESLSVLQGEELYALLQGRATALLPERGATRCAVGESFTLCCGGESHAVCYGGVHALLQADELNALPWERASRSAAGEQVCCGKEPDTLLWGMCIRESR